MEGYHYTEKELQAMLQDRNSMREAHEKVGNDNEPPEWFKEMCKKLNVNL